VDFALRRTPVRRRIAPLVATRVSPAHRNGRDGEDTMRIHLLAAAMSCALVGTSFAHEVEEGKGRLGQVAFLNSCNAEVQGELQRAVAMLHSFWFSAGEKAFRHVLEVDPNCGVATFGIAAILMSNPLAGVGSVPKAAEAAQAAIDQGRRVGAKTQRERDYIEAVAAYYADFASRPERARQLTRAQAFEALAARYPDDDEAQIFAALYLAGTQAQSDQTYAAYLKAAAVLERQFTKYPDHPGVAHYLIHSYDAPPIAAKGLPAARRYAGIAPDAPHALHMPSHIFTRVGAWEDSVLTNRRSADVAKKDTDGDGAFHAADYMVYALLQLGRDREARRVVDEFQSVGHTNAAVLAWPYAAAAMPARMALERGNWGVAARLPVVASRFPFADAITVFARGLGAARSNDVAAAEQEADRLAGLHKVLIDAKNNYWATEVEVQRLAAAAWIAHVKGQADEAVHLMRAAADLEDRNEKHIVTPGRVVPARELLGEMLLELKQPADALKEFELSQQREPNRFRGFAGAARAAEAAGESVKARQHYSRLIELTRDADSPQPEVVKARSFVGLL
jgi:tetratricopeptide (TPR) repeat protein